MWIKYSPQVRDDQIDYEFYGEVITAYQGGQTDTFDFSEYPDGELVSVETTLPLNPIKSAKRVDGVLWIELRKPIRVDATDEEKFPEWQEVVTIV